MNVLSLSYGKDSLACFGACEELGIKIDRVVHAEVWATDDIPADLPPMVEFKKKADEIIRERWGLEVEHVCATVSPGRKYGTLTHTHTGSRMRMSSTQEEQGESTKERSQDSQCSEALGAKTSNMTKKTYVDVFYRTIQKEGSKRQGEYCGWPMLKTPWCNSELKMAALKKIKSSSDMSILGIAADEEERIKRHSKDPNKLLPLVQIGWTEAECRKWCEERNLLSPIYTTATRGGCWFCHNQGIDQLRLLRNNYPDLWAIMLKWDDDSPVYFKPNHISVHDIEERFRMEEEGIDMRNFRWEWTKSGVGGQYSFW